MTLYVMDTDRLSLYERGHLGVRNRVLQTRRNSSDALTITIISVEEQFAGRLAQIRKAATPEAVI